MKRRRDQRFHQIRQLNAVNWRQKKPNPSTGHKNRQRCDDVIGMLREVVPVVHPFKQRPADSDAQEQNEHDQR